jgi:hypothetical protein
VEAAIVDFIPILAYRLAKTELAIGGAARERLAAAWPAALMDRVSGLGADARPKPDESHETFDDVHEALRLQVVEQRSRALRNRVHIVECVPRAVAKQNHHPVPLATRCSHDSSNPSSTRV